jgi:hypothetical protein
MKCTYIIFFRYSLRFIVPKKRDKQIDRVVKMERENKGRVRDRKGR